MLTPQERDTAISLVLARTEQLRRIEWIMRCEPDHDGRGTVDHAPDSVNATMVRVSAPWTPSWIARLVIDPDVTNDPRQWIDPDSIDPDATDGAARRLAYAQEHNLQRTREHAERVVDTASTDVAGEYFARLARFGQTQADYD